MRRLGEGTRKAVEGWGLKLLCKDPRWNSDSLTVIETPQVRRTATASVGPVHEASPHAGTTFAVLCPVALKKLQFSLPLSCMQAFGCAMTQAFTVHCNWL